MNQNEEKYMPKIRTLTEAYNYIKEADPEQPLLPMR